MGSSTAGSGGSRQDLFEAVSSAEALRLLREGNARYLENIARTPDGADTRKLLAERGQRPFVCVLGCSDSRVPPEVVFDVGAGQLFVVRTAGNVADDIAVGSVEYAAEHLHVPLVVVMGHSGCGAVAAAVSGGETSPCVGAIIAQIRPSLDRVLGEGGDNVACRCEDENILHTIEKLKASPVLGELIAQGKLELVGAKYDLASGRVEFR